MPSRRPRGNAAFSCEGADAVGHWRPSFRSSNGLCDRTREPSEPRRVMEKRSLAGRPPLESRWGAVPVTTAPAHAWPRVRGFRSGGAALGAFRRTDRMKSLIERRRGRPGSGIPVALLGTTCSPKPAFSASSRGAPQSTRGSTRCNRKIAGYEASDDEYFRARAADLCDIRDRSGPLRDRDRGRGTAPAHRGGGGPGAFAFPRPSMVAGGRSC